MILESFKHSASRFVGMSAVVEAAVLCNPEKLLEVVACLLFAELDGAEALDARGVDQVSTVRLIRQFIHLREGCRVHALVVYVAQLSRPYVKVGEDGVDKRRLAHSTVT